MVNLKVLATGSKNQSTTTENKKVDLKNYSLIIPIPTNKKLHSLKEFHMCNIGLVVAPKIIDKFTNLTYINISSSSLYSLPEEICILKHLSKMVADQNNLIKLPKNIGELTSLKQLKICHNHLYKLPHSMKSLHNLEYLDLYNNDFEELPEFILKLNSLIGLDIEQNYISTEYLWHITSMRETLRAHWCNLFDCKTVNGPKLRLTDHRLMNPDHSSSLSFSSSLSDDYSDEEAQCVEYVSPETYSNLIDERWDISEDSADEFDPNEHREPRRSNFSPLTFYEPFQKFYCPVDFHQSPVRTQITKMLKETNYDEGQFEDP